MISYELWGMDPQIVWKILSDGNWVTMPNGCEKLSDEWWVMSDEWWKLSDKKNEAKIEWSKLSDQIVLVPTCSPPNPTTYHTLHFLFSLSLAGHSHSCSPFLFFFSQHNTHTHTPLPHPPTGTFFIITSTIFSGKITRKSSRKSHLHISFLW